jgi:hypothetical protein
MLSIVARIAADQLVGRGTTSVLSGEVLAWSVNLCLLTLREISNLLTDDMMHERQQAHAYPRWQANLGPLHCE